MLTEHAQKYSVQSPGPQATSTKMIVIQPL